MKRPTRMHRLARWHIWLGWVVAIPLLLWTISGVVMVARPIDEVRGTTLLTETPEQVLPPEVANRLPLLASGKPVASYTVTMRAGIPVAQVTYQDQSQALFDLASGKALSPLDKEAALAVVRQGIIGGGETITTATAYDANKVPFDFRRPMPVWQVSLADATHVYVGRDTGKIEAVRSRYWRLFDFMWGLHIMDPQTREDTHHPLLVISSVLALVGVVFGTILLFRRRRAKVRVREPVDSPAV